MATTPTEKIRSGLDKREAQRNAAPFKFQNLRNAPKTPAEVHAVAAKVLKTRDKLRELVRKAEDEITKFKLEAERAFGEMGKIRDENGHVTDTIGATQRRKLIETEVNRFAKAQRAELAEERAKAFAELKSHGKGLASVSAMYSSPVARLNLETLSDQKRSVYAQNLANAGPTAVEDAIRQAMLTGDLALAAEAYDRYESLPRTSKEMVRFGRNDVAEAILGERWRVTAEVLGVAQIAVAQGELAFLEGEGRKINPDDKIRVGLMTKELEAHLGRPLRSGASEENLPENETFEQRLDRLYPGVPGSNPDNEAGA